MKTTHQILQRQVEAALGVFFGNEIPDDEISVHAVISIVKRILPQGWACRILRNQHGAWQAVVEQECVNA